MGSDEQVGQEKPCWPFWGQLKAAPSSSRQKIIFEWALEDYFERFSEVETRALRMLRRRDFAEIRFAAQEILRQIDEEVDNYIENEKESLITRLMEEGGYQFGYLPDGSKGTEGEIRYLLENWPAEVDDPSGLPDRNDLSDLNALSNLLECDLDPEKNIQMGLYEAEPHEFYAVLALVKICQAAHSYPYAKRVNCYSAEPGKAAIKVIGEVTIEVLEIMAYADKVEFESEIKKTVAADLPELLSAEVKKRSIERASKAALKRHALDPKQVEKLLVRECWEEWQKQPHRYASKAAFARDMLDKFLNLKSQPVIDGWCRQWEREA